MSQYIKILGWLSFVLCFSGIIVLISIDFTTYKHKQYSPRTMVINKTYVQKLSLDDPNSYYYGIVSMTTDINNVTYYCFPLVINNIADKNKTKMQIFMREFYEIGKTIDMFYNSEPAYKTIIDCAFDDKTIGFPRTPTIIGVVLLALGTIGLIGGGIYIYKYDNECNGYR